MASWPMKWYEASLSLSLIRIVGIGKDPPNHFIPRISQALRKRESASSYHCSQIYTP
jgi:hypothetical protein